MNHNRKESFSDKVLPKDEERDPQVRTECIAIWMCRVCVQDGNLAIVSSAFRNTYEILKSNLVNVYFCMFWVN